jgi:hypothetical protein
MKTKLAYKRPKPAKKLIIPKPPMGLGQYLSRYDRLLLITILAYIGWSPQNELAINELLDSFNVRPVPKNIQNYILKTWQYALLCEQNSKGE